MSESLLNIIKEIVEKNGEAVLSDAKRISAFLADIARNEPKPQKTAFVKCIEHGFAQTLKNTSTQDREVCKQQLAQKLHDEEGFDLGLCGEALDLLETALFDQKQRRNNMAFCTKCGTKIGEGVNFCSGCGAPVSSAEKISQAQPAVSPVSGVSSTGKPKKNKLILAACIVGIVVTGYWFTVVVFASTYESIGVVFAYLSIFVLSAISTVLCFLGGKKCNRKMVLIAGIMFIFTFLGIPSAILCFIAFAKMKNTKGIGK